MNVFAFNASCFSLISIRLKSSDQATAGGQLTSIQPAPHLLKADGLIKNVCRHPGSLPSQVTASFGQCGPVHWTVKLLLLLYSIIHSHRDVT